MKVEMLVCVCVCVGKAELWEISSIIFFLLCCLVYRDNRISFSALYLAEEQLERAPLFR